MPNPKDSDPSAPDELDVKILNVARQNRKRWVPSDIANELKMSLSTIEGRVKRLRVEKRLHDVTLVDLAAAGFPLRYRIDIKINPREFRENKKKPVKDPEHRIVSQKSLAAYIFHGLSREPRFAKTIMVEDVTIVLGDPADLCATVRSAKHDDIFKFVTEGLRSISGIDATSTCQESWSVLTGQFSEPEDFTAEDASTA